MIYYGGTVYDENELINLVDASLDFLLTEGVYANHFAGALSEYLDCRYCLLTNSGSSANLLAISALTSKELGKRMVVEGDEVITPSCGFPATLNPIIQNNLIPVFVDVELGTYNIDVEMIEEAISPRTKVIFIPHTLGNPANMERIMEIAVSRNIWLIEDNCDSLGSEYNGRKTGSFGDISTSSFYPPHHITTGEGGAVFTDSELLRKIIRSFRDWGRHCWCKTGCDNTCKKRFEWQLGDLPFGYDHKYIYSHIGYNLKMTDMQAAIGFAQIEKLPSFVKKRRENFKILFNLFLKYEDFFILPEATKNSNPSWFGFPLLVKEDAPFKRSDIVSYIENHKIATRILYGGNLIKQPAYKDIEYRIVGFLENTDLVMNNLFWMGVYPGITGEKMDYIIETVDTFMEKYV